MALACVAIAACGAPSTATDESRPRGAIERGSGQGGAGPGASGQGGAGPGAAGQGGAGQVGAGQPASGAPGAESSGSSDGELEPAPERAAEPADDPAPDDRCGSVPACGALRAALEADDVAPLDGHVTRPFQLAGAGVPGDELPDLAALRAAAAEAGGLRALLRLPASGPLTVALTRDCARCAALYYQFRFTAAGGALEMRTRGRDRVFRVEVGGEAP